MILVVLRSPNDYFLGKSSTVLHHHYILSIWIFSFPHFGFVGRLLALSVLVPGHCFDFT